MKLGQILLEILIVVVVVVIIFSFIQSSPVFTFSGAVRQEDHI